MSDGPCVRQNVYVRVPMPGYGLPPWAVTSLSPASWTRSGRQGGQKVSLDEVDLYVAHPETGVATLVASRQQLAVLTGGGATHAVVVPKGAVPPAGTVGVPFALPESGTLQGADLDPASALARSLAGHGVAAVSVTEPVPVPGTDRRTERTLSVQLTDQAAVQALRAAANHPLARVRVTYATGRTQTVALTQDGGHPGRVAADAAALEAHERAHTIAEMAERAHTAYSRGRLVLDTAVKIGTVVAAPHTAPWVGPGIVRNLASLAGGEVGGEVGDILKDAGGEFVRDLPKELLAKRAVPLAAVAAARVAAATSGRTVAGRNAAAGVLSARLAPGEVAGMAVVGPDFTDDAGARAYLGQWADRVGATPEQRSEVLTRFDDLLRQGGAAAASLQTVDGVGNVLRYGVARYRGTPGGRPAPTAARAGSRSRQRAAAAQARDQWAQTRQRVSSAATMAGIPADKATALADRAAGPKPAPPR